MESPVPKTVRELAASLGMSKSAVAYALRGSSKVSEATRDRVQARARDLGYRPNPVASAFLHQVRMRGAPCYRANLALLRAGRKGEHQKTQTGPPGDARFIKELVAGALERAQELGYGLEEVYVGGLSSRRLTDMLIARGVLGIAVAPLAHALGHLTLDWSKFAVAAYGHSMVRPMVHRLVHDHAEGMRTAMRALRRKGFTRVGLALSLDSDTRSNGTWSSAYLGTQLQYPSHERVLPLLLPIAQFTPNTICAWAVQADLDAIIIHATGCNLTLPAQFAKMNRRIPCVVLDREESDDCAGIDQQFKFNGRILIDILSSQILHNEQGLPVKPIVSMVKGAWVDVPSLAK